MNKRRDNNNTKERYIHCLHYCTNIILNRFMFWVYKKRSCWKRSNNYLSYLLSIGHTLISLNTYFYGIWFSYFFFLKYSFKYQFCRGPLHPLDWHGRARKNEKALEICHFSKSASSTFLPHSLHGFKQHHSIWTLRINSMLFRPEVRMQYEQRSRGINAPWRSSPEKRWGSRVTVNTRHSPTLKNSISPQYK